MRLRRAAGLALVVVLALGAAIAVPILTVERACRAETEARDFAAPRFAITAAPYARAEGDSFLSYPEWSIVHAYADLAGVTARSSESAFDYALAIRSFWSGLCLATRAAMRTGPVTADQKITNYVIAVSFTAEMALQGAYERTIGAMTASMRAAPTREDLFNRNLLLRYAAFLQQTPWYEFPFGESLRQFWRDVPVTISLRGIERRVALTLQYAGKAAYAAVIRAAAGYAPADLTIRSVADLSARPDLSSDRDIRRLGAVRAADGTRAELIETPRYGAFTELLRRLALGAGGVRLFEIAGNHRILITALVPVGKAVAPPGSDAIFSIPLQSEPGVSRLGFAVAVPSLLPAIAAVEASGARFEHAYDY